MGHGGMARYVLLGCAADGVFYLKTISSNCKPKTNEILSFPDSFKNLMSNPSITLLYMGKLLFFVTLGLLILH